jgi:hypothetical protein
MIDSQRIAAGFFLVLSENGQSASAFNTSVYVCLNYDLPDCLDYTDLKVKPCFIKNNKLI